MSTTLDLHADVTELARQIVACESVSGNETALADALEKALRELPHLQVHRDGNSLVARTNLDKNTRILVAGHLDTVPVANNLPPRIIEVDGQPSLWGRGSVDMKGGVAVAASLATSLTAPKYDLTWVFYDNEEVEATKNGLGRLVKNHPEWLQADLAILGEPTAGNLEGGCNGTLRVRVILSGVAAHSARSWKGDNAVHKAAEVLLRLRDYQAKTVTVDGLEYREGLQAVMIDGGRVKNSVPDSCTVWINYRFAPDKTGQAALEHVREVLSGIDCDIEVEDLSEGARPGLDRETTAQFETAVRASGGKVGPKLGWTDVARFSELGIPALNFGPGDPELCHTDNENCPLAQIIHCRKVLENFLRG